MDLWAPQSLENLEKLFWFPEEKSPLSNYGKAFKCDQCKNSFKSENGLKIHAGKSHKKVTSLSSTPERLRQQLDAQ